MAEPTESTEGKKQLMPYKVAKKFLPKGKEVHTIRQAGPLVLGCHWNKKKLLKVMKHTPIEITGDNA